MKIHCLCFLHLLQSKILIIKNIIKEKIQLVTLSESPTNDMLLPVHIILPISSFPLLYNGYSPARHGTPAENFEYLAHVVPSINSFAPIIGLG